VRRIVDIAHAHGLEVTAHSSGDKGDWAAIRGGVDGIEHLVNVPHALADDMIAGIRERRIVVCPTLAGSSYSVVRGDAVGTIKVGAVADLVLVDGDPLANLGPWERWRWWSRKGRVVFRRP